MRKQSRTEDPLDKFVMTEPLESCPPSLSPPNCYFQPLSNFLRLQKSILSYPTVLTVAHQTCTDFHVPGESLTEMTNLSSEGSDLREGTLAPPDHSDREHE